ncbi:hypothetical protein ATE92_2338 [Ulvibacter sp. MAR_2010_11]|uniref:DUF6503 family protein n=1 Tax=Ulvibacter sp. MAR_2010_11 TaxID=1250229 RepID=UPI000C2C454E|nr:DUF6503 family protein [Ulvibacter sp. MAR_2010_11]PKA84167.1 hypothetical protein ATE92_2338 [Ulvibacter sp. MAR_2010_11]
MKIQNSVLLLVYVTTLLACNTKTTKITDTPSAEKETAPIQLSKAETLLNQTLEAHGGSLYDSAHYQFVFRDNTYQFKNAGKGYEYTKTSKKGATVTKDQLINGVFSRTVNGEPIDLNEKDTKSATNSLNSVIYFATLPHKLLDTAVKTSYLGETTIKEENYSILGVTFVQEGGGKDFDDEYHYWINTAAHKIDYLAYNYTVDEGGVRFRSAYNTRVITGITFQDYINYKAAIGTPLVALPGLYEAGELKELSRIETENIININGK